MKKNTILLLVCLILSIIIFSFQQYNKVEEPNYCKIYADQEQTSYRVEIGGSEKEYGLNGSWIKESKLLESCKEGNKLK